MTPEAEAIDRAKGFFGRIDSEPLVTTDCVLLRELAHALEILWGYSDHELKFSIDPAAPEAVLAALQSGELVARVFRERDNPQVSPIIPTNSWPVLRRDEGQNALDIYIWSGFVRFEQDCVGYQGDLPFVLRPDAEEWLRRNSGRADAVIHPSQSARDAAFFAWVDDHPNDAKPTAEDCERWRKRNRVGGKRTSRAVIRKLRQSLPADSKRPRGAPTKRR